MTKSVYLCSPYSYHSDIPFLGKIIQYYRYRTITKIAARLTEKYRPALILPITQSYQLSKHMNNTGTSFAHWADIDLRFVEVVDEVWVVKLWGWQQSVGVKAEIKHARRCGKPVRFIDPKKL